MLPETYNMTSLKEKAYGIFFRTLTSPTRLRLINELRKGSKNVSELVKKTGLEQSVISHNLKRLKSCGFVKVETEGRKRIYTLEKKTIEKLMDLIDNHMSQHCIHIAKEVKT